MRQMDGLTGSVSKTLGLAVPRTYLFEKETTEQQQWQLGRQGFRRSLRFQRGPEWRPGSCV